MTISPFNVTNPTYSATTGVSFSNSALHTNAGIQTMCAFAVYSQSDTGAILSGTTSGAGTSRIYFGIWQGTHNLYNVPTAGGTNTINSNTSFSSSALFVGSYIFDGTNVTAFANGTSTSNTSFSGTPGTSTNVILGGDVFSGSIGRKVFSMRELLLYTTVTSTSQRQQVEGYLARKWGLLTNFPGTHPFRYGPAAILPTDIAGCTLWLDAADATSFDLSGTTVTAWRDKSSSAVVLGRTGFPTRTSNAVNFTGSQYFSNASFTLAMSNMSVFLVGYNTGGGGGFMSLVPLANGVDWNQSNAITYNYSTNPGELYVTHNFNGTAFNVNRTFATAPLLFEHIQSGTSTTLYAYGTSYTTASLTMGTTSGVSVGARFQGGNGTANAQLTGTINEILVFNTALTATQRQQVEGYLAWKWGLQSNLPTIQPVLPASHPFRSSVVATRPFSPLDVDGLSLWLDAADATTLTLSGSNVTAWADKSGNGYTSSQTTSSLQPIYSNNEVVFSSNRYLNVPQAAINNTSAYAMFLVLQPDSSVNWILQKQHNGVGSYAMLSMTRHWQSVEGTTNYVYWAAHANVGVLRTSIEATLNSPQLMTITYANSIVSSGKNGVITTASATPVISNVTNATNCTLGSWIADGTIQSSGQTNFRLREFIFVSNALTTSQRQQVETYLADKWGLRATMGGAHPSRYSPPSFTPTQISGCLVWLDAADSATFTLSGSNVTQWRDKSGNANHFSTLAGTSPTYSSNEVAFPSGGVMRSSASIALTLNTYAVIVFKLMQPSDFSYVLSFTSMSPGGFTGHYSIRAYAGILGGTAASPGNEADFGNATYFVNGTFNPSFGTGTYSNSPVVVAAKNTNLTGTTTVELSAAIGRYFVGRMYEVILYSSPPTTTQRQQLEGYLAWKWGIQTSLPGSTAPFANLKRALTPVFAPNQIPGCALWLDAADPATVTLSGSNVTAWADKSGNGRNAVGTTSNPTYNATGFNSRPTVTFSNNLLTSSGWSLAPNRQFAWFVVVHLTSTSNTWQRFLISASVGYMNGYLGTHNATSNILGIAGSTTITAPIATGTLSPQLVTYLFGTSELSSNTSAVSVNGGTFSTLGGNTGEIGTNGVIIGTDTALGFGDRFLGHLSEVICYNSDVTKSQRQRIEGYLAEKWGLRGSLGGLNHPSRFGPDMILPTQISGCSLWLDGADSTTMFQDTAGTSLVTSNGQTVRRWNDKSGRGCNATQSGNAPTWNSAGYTTFASASAQNLRLPDSTLPSSAVTGTYSLFAVMRPTTSGGNLTILCSGSSGTNQFNALQIGGDRRLMNLWFNNDVGGGTVPLNAFSIASAVYTGASRSVLLTGSNVNTTNSTGWAGTISNNVIGLESATNNWPFNGDIAELIVYPTALSTTQRQQLEGYLAWKWGIQSSLPSSTHPYRTFKP
jgi:hypothetical protein